MENTKNNKGITLVALIITIVVLLILAVVAIGAVEDSNIIGYAQNAAGSYNQKRAEEEEILLEAEGLLGNVVNSIKTPTPPPPATTVVSYYKSNGVIQSFEITGNTAIGNVYSLNGDTINLLQGPFNIAVSNVENPVTISLSGGRSEDITSEDMQLEVSGYISAYIKGNYLYGANIDGSSYTEFELITDTTEKADIEGKIANLNS